MPLADPQPGKARPAAFNPAIAMLAPPPIPRVRRAAARYDGSNGAMIDLSQAVPGYPAHPDLLHWLAEAAGSPDLMDYGPIEGESLLRQRYAEHVTGLYGSPVVAGETLITAGCNQAFVAAALAVAGAGDAVLLVTPFYFNHDTSLAMLRVDTLACPAKAADGFLPDAKAVEAAITDRVRAVAVVTPNNPTGAIYPPALMERLFDICRARNIWLIADETYRDFLPGKAQRPHDLFARPDWRDHFIGLYSFSKSFCIPGHRLGAITAGEAVVQQIAKVMDNVQICAPRPPQIAVARGLPALDAWREDNRLEIIRRADALKTAFTGLPGWEIEAIGAYFAYVRHPFEDRDSMEVASWLAGTHGVTTLPGCFFGEGQDRFLRLAFANAGVEDIARLPGRLPSSGDGA